MEPSANANYHQIVELVKTLSPSQWEELKQQIENDTIDQQRDRKSGFGCMKGLILYMADDFNEPLDDFKDYM
jgi:hypothetical protein